MNNNAQGQPQGQPGAQLQRPQIFRPEQMRQLPDKFSQEEKSKWEIGLRQLYSQIENNPKDSPQAIEAKRKLYDFSKTLQGKIQQFRQQQAQAAQMAGLQGGAARPGSQGQPQGGESSAQEANQLKRSTIPPKILDHINQFPYMTPSHIQPGSADAQKWITDVKSKYLKALMTMDQASSRVTQLDVLVAKREAEGKPLTPEEDAKLKDQKEIAQKSHAEQSKFVENFRNSQKLAAQAIGASVPQSGSGGPTRPGMTMQQPSNPNPALQTPQINAAMEAARNQQQMGGPRTSIPNGQVPMPNQSGPSHPNVSHPNSQIQNIKQEAGVPHINTQVGQQQRPMNNSPHSALPQSANPQSATAQVPKALTHQAAIQAATRTYSSGPTSATPNVMGQQHHHPPAPRENTMTSKMPIPKYLPERATAAPQAVAMASARPTYSGGPNGAGFGSMGQPQVPKPPPFNQDMEGDRVLNKKKLDELVKQVTGGGDGLGGGEALTPEVEESILNVADSFVDQVLQAACKNAKERGSKVLEIRDIQLTLERGYNIRIPGYASDEIRTVRKIQPSANWISKMSAVQAAKVTGGKNAD